MTNKFSEHTTQKRGSKDIGYEHVVYRGHLGCIPGVSYICGLYRGIKRN